MYSDAHAASTRPENSSGGRSASTVSTFEVDSALFGTPKVCDPDECAIPLGRLLRYLDQP